VAAVACIGNAKARDSAISDTRDFLIVPKILLSSDDVTVLKELLG
jgi:hypothetical protein